MRLLQVMLSPGDGGAETFFEKLAVEFQERGIEQDLVICEHEERDRRLRVAGCRVHAIKAQGIWKWTARGRLRDVRSRCEPALQLAWMSRAAGAMDRVNGVVNLARLGGYYPLKYYRRCDHLIANTPGVVRYLTGAGWPAERISMISNFGEVPDLSSARDLRAELELPKEASVLLGLGRLHSNKAHDVSLRVLSMLPDCYLMIVGSGALRPKLEHLAEDLGVAERVRFLGWRRDIESLYATADLCLFPSRVEPLGNVVLESWAFEVPIVAARSEGPEWLIDDNENGLLFPVDDTERAVAAVRAVLDQPKLGQGLATAGRRKLQKQFSRDVIVGDYERVFAQLCKQ